MSKILLLIYLSIVNLFFCRTTAFFFCKVSNENTFPVEDDLIAKPLLSIFASKLDSLNFRKFVEKMIQLDYRNVISP